MYPWESKELIVLKDFRNQVSKIWNYTELDNAECTKTFLLSELKEISNLVNTAILNMDTEMDRLIKRDCNVLKDHRCSHCESSKIYVCDPCMDKWSKNG